MGNVPVHYVHFLVPVVANGIAGWIAPRECEPGLGGADATLAIPVDDRGLPFDGYWAFVVTLDEGRPLLLEEPFLVVVEGHILAMQTPGADIHFVREARTIAPYLGTLQHPDFGNRFCAITPVKDAAYELLFEENKAVIIGVLPEAYAPK